MPQSVTESWRPRDRSAVALDGDAGKIGERGVVGGDDGATRCPCGRCDQEVVCSPRPALASHGNEELRMGFRHLQVVVDDWNRRDDVLHEFLTAQTRRATRQLDPYP